MSLELPEPLSSAHVLSCMNAPDAAPVLRIACDPARFGGDSTVTFLACDEWVIAAARFGMLDTHETANILSTIVNSWEYVGWVVESVDIDVIGVGGGVVDALWHAAPRYREIVSGINVSFRSSNPARFRNVRSELAWDLRMRFRAGRIRFLTRALSADGIDPALLERLGQQGATIQYKADEAHGGVIALESKDQYKLRMDGKSPDEFDALAMLFNRKRIGVEKRPPRSPDDFAGAMLR